MCISYRNLGKSLLLSLCCYASISFATTTSSASDFPNMKSQDTQAKSPTDKNSLIDKSLPYAEQAAGGGKLDVKESLFSNLPNLWQWLTDNPKAPAFLKRVQLTYEGTEHQKPGYTIETVQPIYMNKHSTIFTQGRWNYQGTDNTINLGLGYRYLLDNQHWMWGVNSFYDMTTQARHKRFGLGGELFGQYTTLRANWYHALSGKKKVIDTDGGLDTFEQALDGYDYSLEVPIPYLPWARLDVGGFHWQGKETKSKTGMMGELSLFILPNLEIDLGSTGGDDSTRDKYIHLSWYLMAPDHSRHNHASGGLFSSKAFSPRDLQSMRLVKVERQNNIIVETTLNGDDDGAAVARGN